MESFRLADEAGVAYMELDVHLTKDDELIVIHDQSVSRTTGRRGRVGKMLLNAIRQLDAGYGFTPDRGRSFPYRGKGLTIPTLDEVLSAFPEHRFTVELKRSRDESPFALATKLSERADNHRVIVASADHELLEAFRGQAPDVPTGFSKNEVRDFLARLRERRLAGYRPVAQAFQVPEYYGLRRVVSKSVIEAIHSYGLEVHVWTVNDPLQMRRLLEWGVDGIMTDDPNRAVTEVDELREAIEHEQAGSGATIS